jgi:integrase
MACQQIPLVPSIRYPRNLGTTMARTRKELTYHDVDRAIADAKVSGRQYEIGDIRKPGLDLRVRGRTASWVLRARLKATGEQCKFRIGDPAKIGVVEARNRAERAKDIIKAGGDPRDWLLEKEVDRPLVHHDPEKDGWTWIFGRDHFLEFTRKERREATYNDYRRTLMSQEFQDFAEIEKLWLKQISPDHVKGLLDRIAVRSPTMAPKTRVILNRCFRYLMRRKSGLLTNPCDGTEAEVLARDLDGGEKLGRLPTEDEMGDLFWRMEKGSNHQARLAGCLITLSGQRIATVRKARVQDFAPALDGRTGTWTIPRPYLKVRKGREKVPHVIPLPPVAWCVVQQAIAMLPAGSIWLFPQARERRKGSGEGGHIAHNTVRNALASGGSKVGPHDNRRAFGTWGTKHAGNSKDETKQILDHGASDVTDRYILHDGTHKSWEIMWRWENWLMGMCQQNQPKTATTRAPLFLIPPAAGSVKPITEVKWPRRLTVANDYG